MLVKGFCSKCNNEVIQINELSFYSGTVYIWARCKNCHKEMTDFMTFQQWDVFKDRCLIQPTTQPKNPS